MRITVAKSAGFCFGVKRARSIALDAARSGRNVYMLGDIVHNEVVMGEMKAAGIGKINKPGRCRGRTLLIRAHGARRSVIKAARCSGYKIIDATCPMVKEIHAIARRFEDQGKRVIIIGDKEHDEVRGIIGQLKRRPIIVSSLSDITRNALRGIKKAGAVVQSTQEEANALMLANAIRKFIPDTVFRNTVCNPTKAKQREANLLPIRNDVMIVVGSRSSANTRRLYKISRRLNKRTHWVNSPDEVKSIWFKRAASVGITAGSSTPEISIREIVQRIRDLFV